MLSESYTGENLVFVVGAPRSGTTWVQRLLASHPCVVTGQESDVFDLYVGPQLRTWRHELHHDTSGRGGLGLGCYVDDATFVSILRRYMLELLEPLVGGLAEGEVFVEKTPSHAVYLPEIQELLPDARVVHMLRDARDVVASLLAASRGWGVGWAPRGTRAATRMWIEHVAAARGAAAGLGERFLEVRYEALHADTAKELRRLVDFLTLEWGEAELAAAVRSNTAEAMREGGGSSLTRGGAFAHLSGEQVVEPPGFVRTGEVGGWRRDLTRRERLQVWRDARGMMASVGYVWPAPW